jgi:RNA polymerase sigma-70 factor (ECF subfamily)
MNGSQGIAVRSGLMALASDPSHESCAMVRRRPAAAVQTEPDTGASLGNLEELTKAISRGDERAFTQFYDLYSLRLYKYLLVLAKGDEREAREVLQTVVVKLARGFKVFDDERRMWGWLCRLMRNAYIDLCRVQTRNRRLVPLEEHQPELVEGGVEEHRLSESLRHALGLLTTEEQELMREAYVDERPLQDLADASGQTYKALESRLARLRQKLKTNLLNHLRHEK